jgi:quinol monooxygenase YgiN
MYARSTTFRGDPAALDEGIAYTRDKVLPAVQQMDGCLGLSTLVDRGTGRCVVTSSWDDAAAMHHSAEAVRGIRETAISTVRGVESETEVVEWEIGVLHRVRTVPEGAAARVISTRAPVGEADRSIDAFGSIIVPRVGDLAGFCSISFFVNRENGRCSIATVYEDRQARHYAKGQAQAMREEFTQHMGMHITDVAEYDVALSHLRVAETV